MAKSLLHLSINSKLLQMAKNSGLNLSAEFEEFIRFRVGQDIKQESIIDPDIEIAKFKQQISKLETQKKIKNDLKIQQEEINKTLDHAIDTAIKEKRNYNEILDSRSRGVAFILTRKLNNKITEEQARKMLDERLKEKGLLNSDE